MRSSSLPTGLCDYPANGLCQSACPTKNGPSVWRYCEVCVVFRMACTRCELGLLGEPGERLGVQHFAQRRDEEDRVLAHRHHGDAARVVDVLIQNRLEPARLERALERLGVQTIAECRELHEEPPIRGLPIGSVLLDVDLRRFRSAHPSNPPGVTTRPACASPGAGPRASGRSARAACG